MALNLEQANAGTFNFAKGGLTTATTTTKIKTAAAVNYTIDGIWQTQYGATDNVTIAAPSGYAIVAQATGTKAAYGVWLDSAGVVTVTQGLAVSVASNSDKAPPPPNPGSRCLIGVFTVYNFTGSAFTVGTTAFGTASSTTTYFDTFSLPSSGY